MKRKYFTRDGVLSQIANTPDNYKALIYLTRLRQACAILSSAWVEACATLLLPCLWLEAFVQM